MPNTTVARNALADAYKAGGTHAALYSTTAGATAGTELTGGTYARQAITWGTSASGVVTGTCTFNVPSGATVAGWGVYSGAAGAYFDGGALTSQPFNSAGTYALTLTFTQT